MPTIIRAKEEHTNELARLFNLYRIFYEQKSDQSLAFDFVKKRLINNESIVFMAEEESGIFSGFVQLYPSFCSVSATPIIILYDLYVEQESRSKGIGRQLMNAAKEYAKLNDYDRLELSTAKDNYIGQALYESLGYQKDDEFFHYSLDV
jgi:ribosomal protein S18 acetylase RimI-like enzyme|tara:strand:- start:132 stop:578 length:447 start_codon:yes stop_codon:yes gene_type:complete